MCHIHVIYVNISFLQYCTRKFLLCVSSTAMSLSLAILGLAMYANGDGTNLFANELPPEVTSTSDNVQPKTGMERVKKTLEKIFGKRKNRRPFFILNMLFLIMRFSGSYVISFYAVEIFRKADPHHVNDAYDSREYLSAIGVGVIKLIGSLLFIPAIRVRFKIFRNNL